MSTRAEELIETIIDLSENQELDKKIRFIELLSKERYTEVINISAIHTSKNWYRKHLKERLQTEEQILFVEAQLFEIM